MKTRNIIAALILVVLSVWGGTMLERSAVPVTADELRLDEEEATVRAVKLVQPAVVSIIIYDQASRTDAGSGITVENRSERGRGTGFLITADGLIATSKHVVDSASPETAAYRIMLNNGKEYYAQLIGRDPVYDLAILKVFDRDLPMVTLGDSDKLEVGKSVIAIGNSLGRYQNSATKGIVSGLGRSITANDQASGAEVLDNVIQTDAEINPGNSGGPLIDLRGRVIGINTAIDQGGESLGFALPVNDIRGAIQSVKQIGRIIRPRLGVRYQMITEEIARDEKLPRSSGAYVTSGDETGDAVIPDSPAAKAGIQKGDIIYEINGIKVDAQRSLLSLVQRYQVGAKIGLKVRRGARVFTAVVVLDEFKQ